MKKLLPIFISVLIISVNVLAANAAENILRGVNVKRGANSYDVELTATKPAKITKTIVSSNRVLFNLKNIEISESLTTKFNGTSVVDNVMVEPCGSDSVNIMVQADNIAYSDVTFKEPSIIQNTQDVITSSFSSVFSTLSGSSTSDRAIQLLTLLIFMGILIGEIKFIKSKYDELQSEKEEMYKNINSTVNVNDYLPGYGRAGIKKPYTTPLYGTIAGAGNIRSKYLKHIRTPEIVTLNTLLHNNNREDKIIDRIINNTPVFGSLSNININDNVPPKTEFTNILNNLKSPVGNVSNPLETARLKANIKHLEEMTALYRNESNPTEVNHEMRARLNKLY